MKNVSSHVVCDDMRVVGVMRTLIRKIIVWFTSCVPEGYEDDTGFHFGTPSKTSKW